MNDNQLIELVGKMRFAQRKYFRTRGSGDLDQARRLETQVDTALRDRFGQRPLPFPAEAAEEPGERA